MCGGTVVFPVPLEIAGHDDDGEKQESNVAGK